MNFETLKKANSAEGNTLDIGNEAIENAKGLSNLM